jgi:hypothetical protein
MFMTLARWKKIMIEDILTNGKDANSAEHPLTHWQPQVEGAEHSNVADWTHGSDETENLLAHVQGAHSENPAEHLLE